MKVLFLLCLLVGSVSVEAQSGPTKDETITFLKQDYFINAFEFYTYYEIVSGGNVYINKHFYNLSNVRLQGCILSIDMATYKEEHSPGKIEKTGHKSESISIDFSRVQEIKLIGNKANFIGTTIQSPTNYYLNFIEIQPNGQKVEKLLPFEILREGQQDWRNPKIIKAFQHLRKLCGAKDPIKFD